MLVVVAAAAAVGLGGDLGKEGGLVGAFSLLGCSSSFLFRCRFDLVTAI